MADITRVGVVGCGTMGSGLAESCARAGLEVLVVASSAESVERGERRVRRSLDHGLKHGKVTEDDHRAALGHLKYTEDLADLGDRQLVLEAIVEDEQRKVALVKALGDVLEDEEAIIASTTSAIPIVKLARAARRPGNVVGTHFFNPVPVMALVEVIESLLTEEEVTARTVQFVTATLGKEVVRSRDRSGFVVNTLLVPYLLAAVRMVESGFASAEDVDRGMTLGCAHPMGPLTLIDFVGVDTVVNASAALYDEFREPSYAPPALLLRMYEAGLLGKKTSRGFYDYR